MKKQGKKVGAMANWQFWLVVWGMGIAGQLCWNMENQWFNTFVYAKIAKDVDIVTWMVILSAFVTTISTFVFGTLSDRMGNRKKFVSIGYIIWGAATIIFGLTEFVTKIGANMIALAGFLVVFTDAIMSFFGSFAMICLHSSEPIDPPPPVTITVLSFRNP
jgi:MFS family permease